MKSFTLARAAAILTLTAAFFIVAIAPGLSASAQSGRNPSKPEGDKKNEPQKKRDLSKPKQDEPQEPTPPVPKSIKDDPPIKISTNVVGIDVTVIEKKTGRLITNLEKKNFTVYEDGVKQEVTNFLSGEGPMTAALLIENNYANRYWKGYFNPTTTQEIFQSAATFVQSFVKPEDHIAIVTYSMRTKVITDFTNDAQRLYQGVISAYRDTLNFSEANIYDALAFTLMGGKSIQLFEEEAGESEYNGLQEVEGHTAVILLTLGIDTFSKLTYDKALKIASSAGVPIYVVHVGQLFFKKYEVYMSPEQRLTYLQAENSMKTFAERTGGSYFPLTFESEIPQIMRSIQFMLRSQYNVGYEPSNTRREGKERKIKIDVDIDGDGQPDNKQLDLRFRTRYVEPDDRPKK